MKNKSQWAEEAANFIAEWGTEEITYKDVLDVCRDIAADADSKKVMEGECGTVDQYATELYLHIRREREV